MDVRIIVSGIICNNDQVLLVRKSKGKPPYPDVWHLPGGRIINKELGFDLIKDYKYNDEYFQNELKRKLLEETNVQIKNINNLCPSYRAKPREAITENEFNEKTQYIFLEFLCDYNYGEPMPGEDIQDLRWISKSKLKNIKVTAPSIEMYKELGWL